MDILRKQEIKQKANEINKMAENFQLIHATYAIQNCIKATIRDYYQQKLTD